MLQRHSVSKKTPSWREYISDYKTPFKADLKLFPEILHSIDEDQMLIDRFRWLLSILKETPEYVYNVWLDSSSIFLREREHFGDLSLDDFYSLSRTFPILLSQYEVRKIKYYRDLYKILKVLLPQEQFPVLMVGPTFGGEIESISYANGDPYFDNGNETDWGSVAEERLLHDDILYHSVFSEKSMEEKQFHFIVLSPWVGNPAKCLHQAYDILEDEGFILFPCHTISMIRESINLGMEEKRTTLSEVSVYCKSGNISGEFDVC